METMQAPGSDHTAADNEASASDSNTDTSSDTETVSRSESNASTDDRSDDGQYYTGSKKGSYCESVT